MRKFLGALVVSVVLSFFGSTAAMAADGTTPPAPTGTEDKDGKHRKCHHRKHHRHCHHRHHRHHPKDKDDQK